MSSSRLRKFAMQCAPRLVSLMVLLGIFCSMAPLAVGQQSKKDLSEPFPCQHRACGCRSAAQCWKRCCCFSNAQKLAWARLNRVKPPEHVVRSAAQEQAQPEKCESTGCCHLSEDDKKPASAPVNESASEDRTVYVVAVLAHQCQGDHWYWNALPWTILPAGVSSDRSPQPATAKLGLASEKQVVANQQPPVPPPR